MLGKEDLELNYHIIRKAHKTGKIVVFCFLFFLKKTSFLDGGPIPLFLLWIFEEREFVSHTDERPKLTRVVSLERLCEGFSRLSYSQSCK